LTKRLTSLDHPRAQPHPFSRKGLIGSEKIWERGGLRLQSFETEMLAEEEMLLTESHLTRRLFGAMARQIEALPLPAG